MDCITLKLLAIGLFVLWLFGPVVIIYYRATAVPRRYKEIADRFLERPEDGALEIKKADSRGESAAWHYARLFDPDASPKDPEDAIREQFNFFHGWNRYFIPLALVIVLSGLMLAFSGFWLADALNTIAPTQQETSVSGTNSNGVPGAVATSPLPDKSSPRASTVSPKDSMLGRIKSPFLMALWGAFVWSLYEILNRRKSGDLTPAELYDVAFRYASALPLGYAFSLLVFDTVPGFLAFAISAFPFRDLQQFLRKQAVKKLDETPQTGSSPISKGQLSEAMSGMGSDTIARLQELNIETYLDLAYTDPIKLLIKTGVPIQLVLAWIDQALLAVYAAPHKVTFEQLGMPCAQDLCTFYERNCLDVAGKHKERATSQAVKKLADRLNLPVEILPQLLRSIYDDPHCQFLIRAWSGPAKSR